MTELPADVVLDGFVWTWIVPALVFAISFLATWALYRHFARKAGDR